ncbi:N-acetylglucosamine-specific PTS transporter subunit IIBC [Pseudomarimonas arenosa]|uniref:PTS transporter subunit EIIC n=1 Tax=Pseudomarimonas arenosa TaxID=2774145 RepID=A0AAW3ZJH2_9GAMM|nr:N-acetylglucosamine-specific PTS transporter subunit IIBC [Pseudomarimonas arenosa]MBD8524864.1 PTS transporter subunit EIIC [Pseudomarimonas arenosa]
MKKLIDASQQLGRALMLPIAVLPVAGLLLRFGQPDLLNMPFVAAAGDAIFAHLGLLFAIGVAVGLAKENHGASGLAGVVGFLVASEGARAILQVPAADMAKLGVPLGIVSGLIAGLLYNRYGEIRLPSYLAFFGGRRFVPIASGLCALGVAAVVGFAWPALTSGMDALSQAVVSSGEIGLFAYGVLNRVLIVTGLHHILNNLAWFVIGDFGGASGDLKRFFAGDPAAGAFMSGFFPVMMFGLPAACLAMYRSAKPQRRPAVAGLFVSMALTSFLTGVTEPIEFSFMFLAPALYAVHAVLTGASMVTMDLLGAKLGFSFSAGAFDYLLNFNRATRPWLLLPVGAVYFGLYYGLFRWCIVRFNLRTPGREPDNLDSTPITTQAAGSAGDDFVRALGGAANLRSVDACTTRLRLLLNDREAVSAEQLNALGARGMIKVGSDGLQVVLGPIADQVATDIRRAMATSAQRTPTPVASSKAADIAATTSDSAARCASGRLMVRDAEFAHVDSDKLSDLGVRAIARLPNGWVHLLHPEPEQLLAKLGGSAARSH